MDRMDNPILSENQAPLSTEYSPTWSETIGEQTAVAPQLRRELAEVRSSLTPTPRDTLAKALTSALILCVPAGFDENDRVAWLKAACAALKDVPVDLLRRGIEAVRLTADHPSKIIPGIMAEIESSWKIRKERERSLSEAATPRIAQPVEGDGVVPCTPEEAAEILAEFGLKGNPLERCKRHLGTPRKPTREDYIALGVDPSVLDTSH